MRKDLFFNSIVGLMIESYSILAVSCLINVHFLTFATYGEIVQSVVCLLTLVAVLAFPLLLVFKANRLWNSESLEGFVEQTQPFFEELDLTKGAGVLAVPFYFLLRRFLMAVIVIFLGNQLYL